MREIQTAIRSLREDDVLQMTHPYGREAEIVYCEVERLSGDEPTLPTECHECGASVDAALSLDHEEGYDGQWSYSLGIEINCDECSFHKTLSMRPRR